MSNSSSDLVEGATALSGRELLAVLGVWLLLSAAAGAVTMLAARRLVPDWGRDGGALIPLVVAEVYASVVVAAAIVLGRRLPAVIALNRAPGHAFTLACVGVVGAYGATAGIHALLAPLIGAWSDVVELLRAIGSDDGRLATAGPGVAAIILLRACCLAPLGEELLFRGAFFTWLRQHCNAPLTIVLTAMAFAGIHMYPPLLPLGFASGVVFGWIRERSNSIAPAIVAHVAHNVLMVAYAHATAGWGARLPAWGDA